MSTDEIQALKDRLDRQLRLINLVSLTQYKLLSFVNFALGGLPTETYVALVQHMTKEVAGENELIEQEKKAAGIETLRDESMVESMNEYVSIVLSGVPEDMRETVVAGIKMGFGMCEEEASRRHQTEDEAQPPDWVKDMFGLPDKPDES